MLEISERLEYKKPRNTKIARKEISVKDIPTRSRKQPLKQFFIGDLTRVILVI